MVTTSKTQHWEFIRSFKDHGKDLDLMLENNKSIGYKLIHTNFGTNFGTNLGTIFGNVGTSPFGQKSTEFASIFGSMLVYFASVLVNSGCALAAPAH